MTQPTCHRWLQQHGGMQAEEARRLTQLEKENARLQLKASPKEWKLSVEAELENAVLQPQASAKQEDLAEGNV